MEIAILLAMFVYLFYLGGRLKGIAKKLEGQKTQTEVVQNATTPQTPQSQQDTTSQQDTDGAIKLSLEKLAVSTQPSEVLSGEMGHIQQESPTVSKTQEEQLLQESHERAGKDWDVEIMAKVFAWMKKDWLAKSGSILLLIGFGWFVSYAFAEGWVGPQGRIAIGLLFGVVVLVFGYFRIHSFPHQGSLFLVLGSSIILLTTWAARTLYMFFDPTSALAIMFLSVAFVAVVAVLQKNERLATVSLLLAVGAPLLTNTPDPSLSGLFSYLLVVIMGTVWVTTKMGWRYLLLIALGALFMYSFPYYPEVPREDAGMALLFAFIFAGLFTVITLLTFLHRTQKLNIIDLIVAGATGLYLLAWIKTAAPAHWESALFAVWSIVFAAAGYMVYRITKIAEPFYVYSGVALVYFLVATIAAFDGPVLTIAITVEAALVPVLSYLITKRERLLFLLSSLMIGPVLLSFSSLFSDAWKYGVPLEELSVLTVLGFALVSLGVYIFIIVKKVERKDLDNLASTHIIIGILYFLAIIWLASHGFFSENYDLGTLIALVVYTIIGVGVYVMGHLESKKGIRFAGGLLVALVIGRLLLIEVWDMEVSLRIVTFFVVGLLLLATAFIEKRKPKT